MTPPDGGEEQARRNLSAPEQRQQRLEALSALARQQRSRAGEVPAAPTPAPRSAGGTPPATTVRQRPVARWLVTAAMVVLALAVVAGATWRFLLPAHTPTRPRASLAQITIVPLADAAQRDLAARLTL